MSISDMLNVEHDFGLITLQPILNEDTQQYFIDSELVAPWTYAYGNDPWERKDHASNFLKAGIKIPLRDIVYMGSRTWGVNDHLGHSSIRITDFALKITKDEKEVVVTLPTLGLFGVTGLVCSYEMSNTARWLSVGLRKYRPNFEYDIYHNEIDIFDKEVDRIDMQFCFSYNTGTDTISPDTTHIECANEDIQIEIIGYRLHLPHHDTNRLAR